MPIDFFEQVILSEVSGKNAAIQAYDGTIWKIRTGFLTLTFAGWGLLLKSVSDNLSTKPIADYTTLLAGIYIFNLGLAFGAWFVDYGFVQRKYRVIEALNALMKAIHDSSSDLHSIPTSLLQVSGDNTDITLGGKSYRLACWTGICVFVSPLVALLLAAHFVLAKA